MFHLTRYYKVVNSKNFIIATQIATYLLAKPGHREINTKTRHDLHIEDKSFNKVCKTFKVFKTYLIPYREMFPDATEKDFMTKNKTTEKQLRVLECSRMPNPSNDEESDEEVEESGQEEEESTTRDLKPYTYIYERPMLYQGLRAVESAGPQGVNRAELTKMMDLDYYDGRAMCKALVRSGNVIDVVVDLGKVKRIQYIAKKYKDESNVLKEYYSEQDKYMELIKDEPVDDFNETGIPQTQSQSTEIMETDTPVIKTEAVVEVINEVMAGLMGVSQERIPEGTPEAVSTNENPQEDIEGPTVVSQVQEPSMEDSLMEEVTEQSLDSSFDQSFMSDKSIPPSMRRRSQRRETILTGKHFKRLSWILEAVREAKLIENVFHLMRNLRAKEKADGSAFMIDKKTLNTLLAILVNQGKIRCIKTVIGMGDNTKLLQFYCDLSIQPMDRIVKSAIEQAKLKAFSVSKESLKTVNKTESPAGKKDLLKSLPESARESIAKLHEFKSKLKSTDMVYDKKCAKSYGYKAKMQRARIVHQLLWYLIYGYQGKKEKDNTNDTQQGASTSKEKNKTPPVYLDEMTWKRYLAPLPEHRGYPKGWCLISDVLLSLPLSLFCALVHVSYKIEGLMEWLNDPVKCLYPISYLPCKISQRLLFARKYIFAFHDNCLRICHMGLLSFGSSDNKEKDQVFIYLHQYASLVDTTASLQGYYKTRMPAGHEPEMKTYHFENAETLEQYWIDLKHFAFGSNLGHKMLTDKDKQEDSQPESIFLSIEEAQSPKTPTTIIDDGIIPGDGRGPAGLDSYMYIHLGRNWSWSNLQSKPLTSQFTDSLHGVEEPKSTEDDLAVAMFKERKQMAISSVPPRTKHQPKERITLIGGKKGQKAEVVKVTVAKTKGNKGGKGVKRKLPSEKKQAKKKCVEKVKVAKKGGKKSKRAHDDKDRTALDLKTGMRVQWSSKEDGLLLTCKIASLVMDKNSRGMIIPWVIVRDVLHKYATSESVDKTSLACQRRVAHSLKNPVVRQNLSIFYAEAIQDQKVKAYMKRKYIQGTDETIKLYLEVVEILIKKFSSADVKECSLPEKLETLKKYTISVVNPSLKATYFSDPTNKSDILESVLRNIFHSYVSADDKWGRSHEMYQLLSQYPDKLLEKVLNSMRACGLIVRIKRNQDAKIIETGIQGVKLSQKYSYRFQSRFPSVIFEDSVECLNQLIASPKNAEGHPIKLEINDLSKGGYCACYIGLFTNGKIGFQTRIPEDIIILDPTLNQQLRRGGLPRRAPAEDDLNSDEEMETEQTDDISDSDSISESVSSELKRTFVSRAKPRSVTATPEKSSRTGFLSRCSMGNRSIIEYEEDGRVKVTSERSSLASRALITMKRSRTEGAHKLKVYNVQDNFVINRCMLKIGLDFEEDRSCQECKVEQISLEEANKSCDQPGLSASTETSTEMPLWKKKKMKKPEDIPPYPDLIVSKKKIADIKEKLTKTLPFQLDIDAEWETFDPMDRQNLQQVYDAVDQQGEAGASVYDLKKQFDFSDLLLPCLQCLEERDMIVKVGVTCTRYVTLGNVRPWAVHAYKNTKGRGSSSTKGRSEDQPDSGFTDAGQSGDVSFFLTSGESWEKDQYKGDNSSVPGTSRRRALTARQISKSKTESTYPKAQSSYERVRLILTPWKKPEGWLNRSVFTMMINSMLLNIMSFPGVQFSAICEKYSPYLQPFCIRQLLDILEELDCVERTVFRKPAKASLFSKPQGIQQATTEDYEDDDIYYEASADCVVKLGQFLDKL